MEIDEALNKLIISKADYNVSSYNFEHELWRICKFSIRGVKGISFLISQSNEILTCVYGYRSESWLRWDFINLRDHVEALNPISFQQPNVLNVNLQTGEG